MVNVPQGATHRHTDGRFYKRNRDNKWMVYSEKLNVWAFDTYVDATKLSEVTTHD